MLGSHNSSQEQDQSPSELSTHQCHCQPLPSTSPSPSPPIAINIHIGGLVHGVTTSTSVHPARQLLISCAEFVSRSDLYSAHRLLSLLSANYSSPCGDSTERLVHQFTSALSSGLSLHHVAVISSSTASVAGTSTGVVTPAVLIPSTRAATTRVSVYDDDQEQALLRSSHLSLNQVTPFIRFSQLTANQAILEAMESHQAIHILDFDIMHGVQWPPLLQAISEHAINLYSPPPAIRITGTGQDLDLLQRTGNRLHAFAESLGLQFQFHPLLLTSNNIGDLLHLIPSKGADDEMLAVNCVHYLHRRLLLGVDDLRLFLHNIKAMNPNVVTVAERELISGGHIININSDSFMEKFVGGLDYYASIFDSLEATLPPHSRERLAVEQIWFGREIMELIVAAVDDHYQQIRRHAVFQERFESWELMLRSTGFSSIPMSPFSLSQAKLLLRLHYPSEGYHLQLLNNALFLAWKNRPLVFVSSWK